MPKLRIVFGAVIIIIVVLLIVELRFIEDPWKEIVRGLVTELFGIAITIVLIDFFLDLRKRKDDVVRLGWHILYEIDRVVWIWQGGNPWFSLAELRDATKNIESNDPIAPETFGMLIHLGHLADSGLLEDESLLKSSPPVKKALQNLKELVKHEGKYVEDHGLAVDQVKDIKDRLAKAITNIELVVGSGQKQSTYQRLNEEILIERQRERYSSNYYSAAPLR